jgi:hypothetical protein
MREQIRDLGEADRGWVGDQPQKATLLLGRFGRYHVGTRVGNSCGWSPTQPRSAYKSSLLVGSRREFG